MVIHLHYHILLYFRTAQKAHKLRRPLQKAGAADLPPVHRQILQTLLNSDSGRFHTRRNFKSAQR